MHSSPPLFSVHLRLLGMAVLWGASWPWGYLIVQHIPPITASAIRFFIASLMLLFWLYHTDRFQVAKSLTQKQWLGLFITGFVGIFSYSVCFLSALQWLPSGKASAVIALNPALTLLLAAFFFKEKLNTIILIGMGLAIFGSLLTITHGNPLGFFSGAVGIGEYLLLLCVCSWVSYTLIGRKLLNGIDVLTTTTLTSLFGTFFLLLASFFLEGKNAWDHAFQAPHTIHLILVLMALGATVLAYLWFFSGVKALGASNAAAYISLVPVFGIAISAVFLGEPLHLSLLIGAPLAVLGMFIMHKGQSQR